PAPIWRHDGHRTTGLDWHYSGTGASACGTGGGRPQLLGDGERIGLHDRDRTDRCHACTRHRSTEETGHPTGFGDRGDVVFPDHSGRLSGSTWRRRGGNSAAWAGCTLVLE